MKILIIALGILTFAACSSMKPIGGTASGAAGQNSDSGALVTSAGAPTTFVDNNGNKSCAPCNQTYHFDFDSNAVYQQDLTSINAQANYLASHPHAKIRIEGNTDERGSREYNVALGWRRTQSVAHLMEQQGVAPKQIILVSYGEEQPVAFGHDETSYSKNRRDNLIYKVK